MWYEIIPCISVMMGAMMAGQAVVTLVPVLFYDRPSGHKRLFDPYEIEHYRRDQKLTGSAYKYQGLEAIPDEDSSKK